MDMLRELVLPTIDGPVRKSGAGFVVCCPAHDDSTPSLSITEGKSQPVVFTCHAGCEATDILAALNLSWEQLCQPREQPSGEWTPHGEAITVYDYRDENGDLLFQVLRTADKQFPQRVPDKSRKSGWNWKLGNTRRVLYRLPHLVEAVKNGDVVYVCEGEKDVHAVEAAGGVATCNPGGAGKWRSEYAEFLRDADVIVVADSDEPGQAHARQVAASLRDVAAVVATAEPVTGKDVADHLAKGKQLEDLLITWGREDDAKPVLAPDLYEFLDVVDPPHDWIIDNILERGERAVITGFEGLGKSMLVRQLAVAAAAGIHPFTDAGIARRKVLLIDCENSQRQSRRRFRPLERAARLRMNPVPEGGLRLIHRPEGIDLSREDAAWLLERVTAHQPDLLVIGPLYRLHAADTNEELSARAVVRALDQARTKVDCALVLEAHAGHGAGGERKVRPVGSSLFLRWPEYGYGIAPATEDDPCICVDVKPWRGPRDERRWPKRLVHGWEPNHWPWKQATNAWGGPDDQS